MEIIMQLIEGSAGALLMVAAGLGAIISFPLAVIAIVLLIVSKVQSWKLYALCAAVPAICLAISAGLFMLRTVLAVFFVNGTPA